MNKHAYLITAYNNWKILKLLLSLLDDEHNDIYLHIDSKANMPKECINGLKHSKLFLIDSVDVRWADYSQVESILKLLTSAYKNVIGGGIPITI
jgi:hypothetical protein